MDGRHVNSKQATGCFIFSSVLVPIDTRSETWTIFRLRLIELEARAKQPA
jgi:hypothetical protein